MYSVYFVHKFQPVQTTSGCQNESTKAGTPPSQEKTHNPYNATEHILIRSQADLQGQSTETQHIRIQTQVRLDEQVIIIQSEGSPSVAC